MKAIRMLRSKKCSLELSVLLGTMLIFIHICLRKEENTTVVKVTTSRRVDPIGVEKEVEVFLRRKMSENPMTMTNIPKESLAEKNKGDEFWKTIVKRYWELAQNKNSVVEIGFSNLTDYFIQRPEFSLWGTNALESSKAHIQTGFTEADRIIPQLILAMEGHHHPAFKNTTKKVIHLAGDHRWFNHKAIESFAEMCPGWALKCYFTRMRRRKSISAVLVPQNLVTEIIVSENVKRLFYILESPYHSRRFRLNRTYDLLSTYWRGSDLVAPYAKWVYYDPEIRQRPLDTNYTQGKTKMAAIFVSNCGGVNHRLKFVRELEKYIQVDVFGRCGNKVCPRREEKKCFEMLSKDYYFYLAFENVNCLDYITEKFFRNALGNNVVPVVMGAHPNDYKDYAPKGSYLHVEHFSSPKALAETMKSIASSPEVYNSFFNWKGTGEQINTIYFCRVCAMLHYADVVPPPTRTENFEWSRSNLRLCKRWSSQSWLNSNNFF